MKVGNLWWHNIPQCKVGDLVRYKSRRNNKVFLVIAVNVEKPCRAHPVQKVTLYSHEKGDVRYHAAKQLEVINERR